MMRVIGGCLKGKKILLPIDKNTRPLRDLVKESIFNLLKHSKKLNFDITDSNILDLFSGSGSFGIECISRGAKKATFVEKDKKAFEILRKNINQLAVQKSSNAINQDIINLQKILKSEKYNIIFLDPPYNDSLYLNYLKILKKNNFFEDRHIVIVHREAKKLDDFKNVLKILVTRQYGRSKIFFGSLN